jgi:hypothetical protein
VARLAVHGRVSPEHDNKFVVNVVLEDPNVAVCLAGDSLSYPVLPDLTIPPDGIAFLEPDELMEINTNLPIQARIENIGGNAYEEDVIVQFFDGYPEESGENQIGTDQNMGHIAPNEKKKCHSRLDFGKR